MRKNIFLLLSQGFNPNTLIVQKCPSVSNTQKKLFLKCRVYSRCSFFNKEIIFLSNNTGFSLQFAKHLHHFYLTIKAK